MTPTSPRPLYSSHNLDSPAYHLRYTWTGWPSKCLFPEQVGSEFFTEIDNAWEDDGIRRLEVTWSREQIQITCSVKACVSPTFFVARLKGRLQHALRLAGTPIAFSRKIAFRSIGENRREQVEAYIANQVGKAAFVDARFAEFMESFTEVRNDVHLDEPSQSNSGRYWYNLHLVLVTESRMRFNDQTSLERISQTCDKIVAKNSYWLSRRALMPDHMHLSLRGNIEHSPEEIALTFMNNIAFSFGQNPVFRPSYYVGTFGEYDMGAVRKSIHD